MENTLLGVTKDGYNVYDRSNSHLHFEQGITKELMRKALKKMYANGSIYKRKEIYFAKPIGFCKCLETTSEDEVVMVYRKGRSGKTPMVKGRKAEPSNTITVIVKKDRNSENYILITAYVGSAAEREPWDKSIVSVEEKKRCEEFWKNHAMMYDPESIDWDRM